MGVTMKKKTTEPNYLKNLKEARVRMNTCPHGCLITNDMKDGIWDEFDEKEQSQLKKQWTEFGGWCEHWNAKWGYEELWAEIIETADKVVKH